MTSEATRPAKTRLSVVPIQRATMQEDVYKQAKQLILNGDLAPGQSITIQWLADSFGVSAMPVREAIQRLTAEKALTVVTGRSLGIPPLSRARLDDLTRNRLEIESTAVIWAVEEVGAALLNDLARLIAEMDNIKPNAQARKIYLRANREFHFSIYRASGSETLLGVIEGLWLQISPYFNLLQERGNYEVSNRHHRKLVNALKRRDRAGAAAALRADIIGAANVLQSITF
jgi:DNA-binding GntR family transcriptional regulator